jgi:hypothetical protein
LYYNNRICQGFFVVQKRILGEKIMQEWEYKVVAREDMLDSHASTYRAWANSCEQKLVALGSQGWELAAITQSDGSSEMYIFKRPKS